MEDVQSILMSLPPEVVVAGLDGEPVLRYEALEGTCSDEEAQKAARDIFKQARVRRAKLYYLRGLRGKAARIPEKRLG